MLLTSRPLAKGAVHVVPSTERLIDDTWDLNPPEFAPRAQISLDGALRFTLAAAKSRL